jgi:SAM-dependent methyltransferase
LLLPIEYWAGFDSVEDSFRFFRLNEPLEHFAFRLVEPCDLLLDAELDDLAERRVRAIELKCSRTAALAGHGLIVQGECDRHLYYYIGGGWRDNYSSMSDSITRSIRESYDRVADEYARQIYGELRHKPLDRGLLDRFAAEVAGRGEVCDMGCGPGQVARYLRDTGATVFGLDLSPRTLEQARRLNPDIPFREGNMLSLDLPDGALAGITAFYAIVNISGESLPSIFREMLRVLQPGGLLLLAFHSGDEILHEHELWGRPISMDFILFQPVAIRRYLEAAGFSIEEIVERDPYSPDVEYQSRRAYIFARNMRSESPQNLYPK